MKNIYKVFCVLVFSCLSIFPSISQVKEMDCRESLFLTKIELQSLQNAKSTSQTAELLQAMRLRVNQRASTPNLTDPNATTEWWHHASEYLTDAALIYAVSPTEKVGAWLRGNILAIVRRPVSDWAGPRFRGYGGGDLVGGLETAHLTWAIGISYDLASNLFTLSEQEEIKNVLREKGMLPCRRYLQRSDFFHNWNCILFAGMSVAASVLQDNDCLQYAVDYLPVALDHFQKDGSYGESLQYANYAAYGIMIGYEALLRSKAVASTLMNNSYAKIVDWASYAHFYRKPLSGWSLANLSRSANFGDCASIFRPSADLLIHIASRFKQVLPVQAGIARQLFDTLYFPVNESGVHDLASFGMVNDFGFLSIIMLSDAATPISPQQANYSTIKAFSGGDAFMRDNWDGKTVVAARIPAEPRYASAHLHGDINSIMLVHNGERLLVDPGHTCYRNTTRLLDVTAASHSTCTFEVVQTETSESYMLDQRGGINRPMKLVDGKKLGDAPIFIGGKRLLNANIGEVSVLASDAAELYGDPLQKFNRFIILCGSNALFIVDQIESSQPIRTTWNWLMNNRDGKLYYDFARPSSFSAIRGNAGLIITNYAPQRYLDGPAFALVHDAYHILPNQFSEGKPGSGILMRFKEVTPQNSRIVVHTISMDTAAANGSWESKTNDNGFSLISKDRNQEWNLNLTKDGTMLLCESVSGQQYKIAQDKGDNWSLNKIR